MMIALTVFAPVLMLVVFGDEERFFDQFDLLMFLGLCVSSFECSAALGTGVEFECDGLVDLIVGKGSAKVLLVSFLTADLFLASAVLLFGWFNDVGRRRLGRVAGVFFESSDERSETGDFCFELGNFLILFGDPTVLGIH